MGDLAIKVDGISKAYRIGLKKQRYDTLGAAMATWIQSPFKNFRRLRSLSNFRNHDDPDIFWALKDISFEVMKGDVIGIIGKNGAGKSTLLKILSRITDPTSGRIDIFGRVASLLEVGTGFNNELTGRENVYLNGTILGMTKKEVDQKFDEIVEFSGVETFIDTPVKRYSSGMKVRLAFAVAAHLESEILIVDEVLAVGDAEFQRKCMGKMQEVSVHEGRTVLFVSHQLDSMVNLCTRGAVFENGRLIYQDSIENSIGYYLKSQTSLTFTENVLQKLETGIISVVFFDMSGKKMDTLTTWEDYIIRIKYGAHLNVPQASFILSIKGSNNQRLIVIDSGLEKPMHEGEHSIECILRKLPLTAGSYTINIGIGLSNSGWIYRPVDLFSINVLSADIYNIGRPPRSSRMIIAASYEWK